MKSNIHCSLSRGSKKEQNRWNGDDWWRRDDWVFVLRLIDNIIVILRAAPDLGRRGEKRDDESTCCCRRRSCRCDAVHYVACRQLTRIVYLNINNNTLYYILNYYYYFVGPRRRWPPAPPRILGTRPSGEPRPPTRGGKGKRL